MPTGSDQDQALQEAFDRDTRKLARVGERFLRHPFLWIGGLVVLLAVVIPLASWAFNYGTAETRGRVALHNQQRSAVAIQDAYEYFHNTCHAIIADGQQMRTLQDQIDTMVRTAPAADPFGQYAQQVGQLRTDLTGLSQKRDNEAQAYDARSHEWTVNFMRSRDLPVEIGPPNGDPYAGLRCER